MPSSGKIGAVSDYEHLNSQHFLQNSKQFLQAEDSTESDFLPLKPSKSKSACKSVSSLRKSKQAENSNTNSNNSAAGVVRVKNTIGLTQMLDDFGHLQSLNEVPIPTAWSPSIKCAPNPALLITPEKTMGQLKSTSNARKGTLSDLQSTSNVPVPVAWSPGMVVKPNPALMVTPDKTGLENITGLSKKEAGKIFSKFTAGENTMASRTKDKPTVRFDLPSREETLETSQEFFSTDASTKSPITLKGRELTDNDEPSSPPWKAFSPQKAYDPNAYSDDSVLDDSIQKPCQTNFSNKNLDTAKKTLDIEDSTSDRLAVKLQELLLSSANQTLPQGTFYNIPSQSLDLVQAEPQKNVSDKSKADLSPSRKIMSAASIPRHPQQKRTAKINHEINKRAAGPEFIKTPASAYEPKPADLPQPQVYREWDSSPEKNNYSFPFDGASGGDLVSENTFARPEYNSTLRVRSELDELCKREIDVEKAVASALTKSESKRTELNEKASIFTNRMSDQFGELVNLDPSVENLCSKAVRMRTTKTCAKKVPSAATKPSKPTHAPPDLMEFFPPDLQKESPDFSLPGVKKITTGLQGAPHGIAFDLYRHNRVWQGISDY